MGSPGKGGSASFVRLPTLAATSAVLIFFVVAAWPGWPDGRTAERLNAGLAASTFVFDSTGQRWAHRAVVGWMMCLALFGPWLHQRVPARVGDLARQSVPLAAVGGLWWAWEGGGPGWLTVAVTLVALAVRRTPTLAWAIGATSALGVGGLLLLGPCTDLDLSGQDSAPVTFLEMHYAMVVGPGAKVAAGFPLGTGVKAVYGPGMTWLAAIAERGWGPLPLGAYSRGIAAMNLIVVAAVAGVAFRRSLRSRWGVWAVAVASGLAFTPFGPGWSQPNLTAWRFGGLFLGLAALDQMGRTSPRVRALWIGILGALGIWYNPETGIALAVGLAVYTWCRDGRSVWGTAEGFVRVTLAVGGSLLTWTACLGALAALQGELPEIAGTNGLFADLLLFSGGYGGHPVPTDPFLASVLVVASWTLISVTQRAHRPVTHRSAWRGAVAATTVVWLGYLANRAHPFNAASFVVLTGWLTSEVVDLSGSGRSIARRFLPMALLWACCVVPGLGPSLEAGRLQTVDAVQQPLRGPRERGAVPRGGAWLSPDLAAVLDGRAAALKARSNGGPVWYFTVHSWLMPAMSGVYPPYAAMDCWGDTVDDTRYERLLAQISAARPREILFDDADARAAGHWQRPFYAELKSDLDAYHLVAHTDGWEVWRLRDE